MTEQRTDESLGDWTWIVGEIVGVFGIRGELKVRLETDFPDRFAQLKRVCLRSTARPPRLFDVTGSRLHKSNVLLTLASIDSIEKAEEWRGAKVQVQRSSAIPLPAGSYYSSDIVGMDVFTRAGVRLGKLERVLPYPGHDLFQVGEALIPAVRQIVVEVDTENRRIIVDPPEGMLPGELADVVEQRRDSD